MPDTPVSDGILDASLGQWPPPETETGTGACLSRLHEGRHREIVDKYKVSIYYTAPTLIRAFMKWGREIPDHFDLSSLQVLGSVGEPINPEAWMWYRDVIGKCRRLIVDACWQTEIDAMMISFPRCSDSGRHAGLRLDEQAFCAAISQYYELPGWDAVGVPLPSTLTALGLKGPASRPDRATTP